MARNRRTSLEMRKPSDDSQVARPLALVPSRILTPDKFRPYKGVTFYKRTGRWEANIWYENKQHYLGASFSALEAARAYDKAILFTRSATDQLNFHPSDYNEDMEKMKGMNFIKYRQYLRDTSRKTNCQLVKKGILIDENGKWEVKYQLKNLQKPKYVLVGWFDTKDEALRAYNSAALHYDEDSPCIRSFHEKQLTGDAQVSPSRRKKNSKAKMAENMTSAIIVYPLHTGLTEDQKREIITVTPSDSLESMDPSVDVSPSHTFQSGEQDDQEDFDIHNPTSIVPVSFGNTNVSGTPTVQQQLYYNEYPFTVFGHLRLIDFMRAEGYNDIQIVNFIQWMEGNRAQPHDYARLQFPEIQFLTENIPKAPSDLSHLKLTGPFDINLSLSPGSN